MSEALWSGDFGNQYIGRNEAEPGSIRARMDLWADILGHIHHEPESVLEVGANIGLNLRALRGLTDAEFWAVEPNEIARRRLWVDAIVPAHRVLAGDAAHIELPDNSVDLVFTSGVLIHIHPDNLMASCREIHRVSKRYIVAIEYFSAKPEEIEYRGRMGALWKRDFGALWLDNFDLKPIGCGFAWKRMTGLDNLTYWIFEKQ